MCSIGSISNKGYRDTRQITASVKRSMINTCNGIGNLYTCQAAAFRKRIRTDGFHAIRDCNVLQTTASRKCRRRDLSDTIAYLYTSQSTASRERPIANTCNAVGNFYARKTTAFRERLFADACYAVGDIYARKSTASIERIRSDACDTTITRDNTLVAPQNQCFSLSLNQAIIDVMIHGIAIRYNYALKAATMNKRFIMNDRDAVGNSYARKATAIIKRLIADALDTVGNPYTSQIGATRECAIRNYSSSFPYLHRGDGIFQIDHSGCNVRYTINLFNKVITIYECSVSDSRNTLRDNYTREFCAPIERPTADTRHTVRNHYAL